MKESLTKCYLYHTRSFVTSKIICLCLSIFSHFLKIFGLWLNVIIAANLAIKKNTILKHVDNFLFAICLAEIKKDQAKKSVLYFFPKYHYIFPFNVAFHYEQIAFWQVLLFFKNAIICCVRFFALK